MLMYKLLLCWRYLRTRYIALASIVSVMLGVATMIVVNSVMAGFTHEMRNRIHGILSDMVVESHSLEGFPDADWHMERIREIAGDSIAGHDADGARAGDAQLSSRRPMDHAATVMLIGIDERTQRRSATSASICSIRPTAEHLSFELRAGDYDTQDHQVGADAPERTDMESAGWPWRRFRQDQQRRWDEAHPPDQLTASAGEPVRQGRIEANQPFRPDQPGDSYDRSPEAASPKVIAPAEQFQRREPEDKSNKPIRRNEQ